MFYFLNLTRCFRQGMYVYLKSTFSYKLQLSTLQKKRSLYIFHIIYCFFRWIFSEYTALKRLLASWKLLVNDLLSISNDNIEFTLATTRNKALGSLCCLNILAVFLADLPTSHSQEKKIRTMLPCLVISILSNDIFWAFYEKFDWIILKI